MVRFIPSFFLPFSIIFYPHHRHHCQFLSFFIFHSYIYETHQQPRHNRTWICFSVTFEILLYTPTSWYSFYRFLFNVSIFLSHLGIHNTHATNCFDAFARNDLLMEASKKETCLLFLISTYTECMCRVCSLCICEVEVEMKCDDYTFFFRYMVVLVFQSTSHSLLCVHTVQICLKTERKGKLCMLMEGIENINMLLIFSWMRTRLPEVGVSKNQRLCIC